MLLEAAASLQSACRTAFPNAVALSNDGQLSVLTHAYIHILTPALGLSMRTHASTLTGLPGNKSRDQWDAQKSGEAFLGPDDPASHGKHECLGMQMFHTVIEVQKREIEWDEYTNDARLTVAGGLDNGFRMTSWSPSGLSELGGCILATLNVNREVHIFTPSSDVLKGTWNQAFDLTDTMLGALNAAHPGLADIRTLDLTDEQRRLKESLAMQAQATSIAWSGPTPRHPLQDDSLLAVGQRSGGISFWRYSPQKGMSMVGSAHVSDTWPLVMAWKEWQEVRSEVDGSHAFTAQLAVSSSSGPICILSINSRSDSVVSSTQMHAILSSPKTVTCLKWLGNGQLAIARLGELHLWTVEACRTIIFPIDLYRGWTSIASLIEVTHFPTHDSLLVTMSDGTFRQIVSVSSTPTLLPLSPNLNDPASSSGTVTDAIRRGFLAVEKVTAKRGVGVPSTSSMGIAGLVSLGDASGMSIWSYERYVQDIKVYHPANMHKTTLLAARIFDDDKLEHVTLDDLKNVLEDPKPAYFASASQAILPFLLAMRHFHDDTDFAHLVYSALVSSVDRNADWTFEASTTEECMLYLSASRQLQSIRLAGLLAKYWATNLTNGHLQQVFEDLVERIYSTLYAAIYALILRILENSHAVPSAEDALRDRYKQVVDSLQQSRMNTDEAMQDSEIDPSLQPERSAEMLSGAVGSSDKCAACGEDIALTELGRATCRNGHEWQRCSVTLDVLYTISTRTCTVCARKSRLPAEGVPEDASATEKSAQQLLRIAKHCLFCGGRWTRGY